MPVYFGLPLTLIEIIRILGLDNDENIDKIKNEHSRYYGCYLCDYLNKVLMNKQDKLEVHKIIQIYPTDKGQYVLGYEVVEVANVWDNLLSVDNMIILLFELKNKFKKDVTLLNIDLSYVSIEHMEGYPTYEKNPEPYILEWS